MATDMFPAPITLRCFVAEKTDKRDGLTEDNRRFEILKSAIIPKTQESSLPKEMSDEMKRMAQETARAINARNLLRK